MFLCAAGLRDSARPRRQSPAEQGRAPGTMSRAFGASDGPFQDAHAPALLHALPLRTQDAAPLGRGAGRTSLGNWPASSSSSDIQLFWPASPGAGRSQAPSLVLTASEAALRALIRSPRPVVGSAPVFNNVCCCRAAFHSEPCTTPHSLQPGFAHRGGKGSSGRFGRWCSWGALSPASQRAATPVAQLPGVQPCAFRLESGRPLGTVQHSRPPT